MDKPDTKQIDADTRFYVDLDLKTQTIIGWGYGQRHELAQKLPNPNRCRLFLTKGQYKKLEKAHASST